MRVRTLTVAAEQAGRSVESLLRRELMLSSSLISRLKRRPRGILVNGERAYTTRRVTAGDVLMAEVGDDPAATRAEPMAFPLDILYEDADLLVIDKPAGIAVHASTRDPSECTLENALAAYLPEGEIPHPVSRLDRGTTGVMTFAKNGYMHELLRRVLHTDAFFRTYLGISVGRVDPPAGEIALPIGLAPGSTYRRAAGPNGAPSRTEYETLENTARFTLLKLIPRTGRTHQLRVHLAAVGYPLAGDWLYGVEDRALIARPALHSHALRIVHPLTGETLDLVSPLPDDMARLMRL